MLSAELFYIAPINKALDDALDQLATEMGGEWYASGCDMPPEPPSMRDRAYDFEDREQALAFLAESRKRFPEICRTRIWDGPTFEEISEGEA